MAITNVKGLEKLYQAVSEALEIEKCSICLERLENTVLLWPCTHWFCSKCISTLHKSAQGKKVTCPLCKSVTTQRKVLRFHDKQKEYEDHLQTLIGALSLDLKFDVTSYKNMKNFENSTNNAVPENNKPARISSPQRKTMTRASVRVIEVKQKPELQQSKNKRTIKRSGNLQTKSNTLQSDESRKLHNTESPKLCKVLLPNTPKEDTDPREQKVMEWLDSNKFSQADQDCMLETVVADVHKAELDNSLCLSENQLQSVSQVYYKNVKNPVRRRSTNKFVNTPSDIEAIKPLPESSVDRLSKKGNLYKNKTAFVIPAVEKFDELFPEGKTLQTIKTTYGSKNPYTSTRRKVKRFAVQDDLFKSIDGKTGKSEKSSPEKCLEHSEETLEDFSSGSGEEWTIEKKPRKSNLINKSKALKTNYVNSTLPRKSKNSLQTHVSVIPNKAYPQVSEKQDMKDHINIEDEQVNYDKSNKIEENANEELENANIDDNLDKPQASTVKEIIDDWNDTKYSNNIPNSKSQPVSKQSDNFVTEAKSKDSSTTEVTIIDNPYHQNKLLNQKDPYAVVTPLKEVNSRSPGWSRLQSTKKEFHMSEKKKLSLKTLNKSNSSVSNVVISPSIKQSRGSAESSNKTDLEQGESFQTVNSSLVGKMFNPPQNDINKQSNELNVDICCHMRKQISPEWKSNLNKSLASSASGSPFKGFTTPQQKECLYKAASNSGQPKESFQKSRCSTVLSCKQKKYDVSSEILDKDPIISDDLLKENCKETDVKTLDDDQTLFPSKINKDKQLPISKRRLEGDCRFFLEKSCIAEESKLSADVLQEFECPALSKKRDRDSGIHNESGISSPVRKRVCRDAEVQTSPGRMQSVIRDMLKSMWGIELEHVIMQSNRLGLIKDLNNVKTTNSQNQTYKFSNRLSQDSDKENLNTMAINNNAPKKYSDDSDIILGTEDCIAPSNVHPNVSLVHKTSTLNTQACKQQVLEGLKQLNVVSEDFDPDAPTQPSYKTPVTCKRHLQTSTKEYSVVSNPTGSELKRVSPLFDKSDVLFCDDTPKGITPWNQSGISQLEINTGTVKKHEDENSVLISTQNSKEKVNRSRRQLDFVDEDSNDMFELITERQLSGKSKELDEKKCSNVLHNEENIKPLEENEDIFRESNEVMEVTINIPNKAELTLNKLNTEKISSDENREKVVGTENLSDTPGIVWPTEVQFFEGKIDSRFSNKANEVDCCNTKINTEKSSLYSNNIEIDPVQESRTTIQQQNSPSGSSASSDVCFVEGTPQGSQIKVNEPENLDFEEKMEEMDHGQFADNCERINPKETQNKKDDGDPTGPVGCNFQIGGEKSQQENSEQNEKEENSIIDNELTCGQRVENTEVEDENLCFASSLLNPQQNQVLACVLSGMGLPYSKTVGPHISHLIVGTKNGCFQNTYKVLHAMALHKPIIRFDWVEEVIRTGGTVPLDPFVALDPSGECGVFRAKADKKRELLLNFAVHIYNVNDRIVQKEQIEELVRLCGGVVVKELNDFHNVPRDKFRIIILSESPDSLTQGDWRQKYSAAEVMIDWIYSTIGRYRLTPLVPFMVIDTQDAISFLQHEGYPEELVFDSSTQG